MRYERRTNAKCSRLVGIQNVRSERDRLRYDEKGEKGETKRDGVRFECGIKCECM